MDVAVQLCLNEPIGTGHGCTLPCRRAVTQDDVVQKWWFKQIAVGRGGKVSGGCAVTLYSNGPLSRLLAAVQVRCLVDVPGSKLPKALEEHLTEKVASQLPEQLQQPFLAAVRSGDVRSMRNKLMPAVPQHTMGAVLLGDSLNMRHPLTGRAAQVGAGWRQGD